MQVVFHLGESSGYVGRQRRPAPPPLVSGSGSSHPARGDPARGAAVDAYSATPTRGCTAVSDASGVGPGPDGEVDLVQLLTPEGVRVDHPQYEFAGDDAAIKGFYRDMVMTRRIDAEATA